MKFAEREVEPEDRLSAVAKAQEKRGNTFSHVQVSAWLW